MSATIPITLTGFVGRAPEITDTGDGTLLIRFLLVYSPTDELVDDVTLPCVIREERASRADVEEFLCPTAAVQVRGYLRLPDRPAAPMLLEVAEIAAEGEDDTTGDDGTADPEPEIPLSVTTVEGYTVVVCQQADGARLWHVIAPTGCSSTALNEAGVPLAIAWLSGPHDPAPPADPL